MMLLTLLLLFLNTSTHATDDYDSLKEECFYYGKEFKVYTIRNPDNNNKNIKNIKSKLKYKRDSGEEKTSEQQISLQINVYFPEEVNDDVAKQEIKSIYLNQINIKNIIENGINNDTFKSCDKKIHPLIQIEKNSDDYDSYIYYEFDTDRFVKGSEDDVFDYCRNRYQSRLYTADGAIYSGTREFKERYLINNRKMPQEKLLISIFHGMTIQNKLSDKRLYIPYFEQYSDFQTYVNNKVGGNTKIVYTDDKNNYKLIKDQESYNGCKKDRKCVWLKYIEEENIEKLKEEYKKFEYHEEFLQTINAIETKPTPDKTDSDKTTDKDKTTQDKSNPTPSKTNNQNSKIKPHKNKKQCCCNCCRCCRR